MPEDGFEHSRVEFQAVPLPPFLDFTQRASTQLSLSKGHPILIGANRTSKFEPRHRTICRTLRIIFESLPEATTQSAILVYSNSSTISFLQLLAIILKA